ncbi:poly-gamma-glutamate biosynthesis protein [Lysobacter daejeonensis GH1-9]|uniref:Poly-gamma-glutamate biosynthesis protein n=1 Tax=Lysobacter daejeonensis GH1-9 TaxID=1385517 RepID=A0A0A0ETZ6_9GAMM|nr:poly-gamma-glutamate biosynthesis protein [Lysobacter daejeonensis GH1-9]
MRGRRHFLKLSTGLALGMATRGPAGALLGAVASQRSGTARVSPSLSLFLCGDVMLGRGIDQILPHPSAPTLHEAHVRNARRYVTLAEWKNGEIPRPVAYPYVWGEALAELERRRPDARIVNLETAITRSDRNWPKGINYRMHPGNLPCLTAAGVDCCVLSNNHVLDWERDGLRETLATLQHGRIASAGAGADLAAAQAPAILPLGDNARILVFAAATGDSGVPPAWAANPTRSGVSRLPDLSASTVDQIAALVRRHRRKGDCVVFSLHWGGNWGYAIPPEQRDFAHALIDEADVDVIHGHSSHHAKAIEVHRDRLILYGCGDFINDYEGIGGHEEFRGELGLMYFPVLARGSGRLLELTLTPTRLQRFRVHLAGEADRRWLHERLHRECRRFGSGVEMRADGRFSLRWQ